MTPPSAHSNPHANPHTNPHTNPRTDPARRATLDDRFALASAAAGSERRNRPTLAVTLAILVLVGSIIYLLTAMSDLAEARRVARRQSQEATRLVQMVEELRTLEAKASQTANDGLGVPITDILTRFERYATEAGLVQPLSHRRGPGEPRAGGTLYRYTYEIRDPSLSSVMRWFELVTSGIAGTEIQSLKIRPEQGANTWYVSVTLQRWERSS